jgi:AhpD family alkylhydroperoxidase
MARFITMRASDVSEELLDALGRTALQFDDLPETFKMLASSPAAFKAFVQADTALTHGSLSPQRRSQIALAVSQINGSAHDVATQTRAGMAAGLSEHDLELARRATATDPKTSGMLKFVQALVLQRGQVPDTDFHLLREAGFADGEIVEVVANVALNIFTNYLNLVAALP